MAIIDVVKFDGNADLFAWKFPSENLRTGSQLVVKTSQYAFFVEDGLIYDEFPEGRYTLETRNLPLINKIINFPFGGNSPFQAEVWFINLALKLDNKWGTHRPIQIMDPHYSLLFPLRAFGQFGMAVDNPRKFLQTIVGSKDVVTTRKILDNFKGLILSTVSSVIKNKIRNDKVSVFDINSFTSELSKICMDHLKAAFSDYGLNIEQFFIISINIPDTDPSVVKLKSIKTEVIKNKLLSPGSPDNNPNE